jgi:hypothetical protein
MPWVFAGMIVLGLGAAATGSVKLVITWLVLMVLIGIVGFVDFYMWGYDYGHNLNPNAAIKVPGMSYQPPLFGCKQLLKHQRVFLAHYRVNIYWVVISDGRLGYMD